MAAQHARSASEQPYGGAQTHPQYFKAGTIERIFDDCGSADGRRLPFQSKSIAAFLILKAQKNRGYTCVMPEREICSLLGLDGKTFRKYLAPLIEAKLVIIDKNRRDATRCFDCKPLFKRFADPNGTPGEKVSNIADHLGDSRSGNLSRSVDSVRETALEERETFCLAPGNDGSSVRESIPSPTNTSSFLLSSPDLKAVFEERFGKAPPPNCDRELRLLLYGFDAFDFTERRQRALVTRYGIYTVADAIAYVITQQRSTKVQNPAGFVTFALEHGLHGDTEHAYAGLVSRFGKVSQSDPDSHTVAPGGPENASHTDATPEEHEDRVIGDLWTSILLYLEPRLSTAELNMLVRPARPLAFEQGLLTLGVSSAWARDRLKERCADAITTAVETLLGPPVMVEIRVAQDDTQRM